MFFTSGHPTAYEPSGDPGYVPNNHNAHAQQPLTESFNGNPDSHQHYTQLLPQSAPPPHVHPMPQQPHLPHHNGNTHFRPKAPPDSSPEAKGMPPQTYLPDTPIKTEPDPDATPSTPPFNYRAPPGRRPSLPPVDMDANELLKVIINTYIKFMYPLHVSSISGGTKTCQKSSGCLKVSTP